MLFYFVSPAFREGTQYTEVIKFNYAGVKMKKLE